MRADAIVGVCCHVCHVRLDCTHWVVTQRDRQSCNKPCECLCRGYVPGDGVPGLPDWECIPTPGHTPGHVAFFRKSDRVLITGDACLTVDIDSFWGLLRNKQSIARPPSVATWNWQAAKASVAALARIEPSVLACGHGIPMMGAETARDLVAFADHFSRSAMKSTSNCAP